MAEYDRRETEFERMQRQATERMREMQRRARPPVQTHADMPPTPSFVQIPGRPTAQPAPAAQPNPPRRGADLLRLLNLKNLELDRDRVLLFGLALLLAGENCDETLLLALLYLML